MRGVTAVWRGWVAMVAVLLALGPVLAGAARAEPGMADPPPSIDHPRKVLLQLSSDDPRTMNLVLNNAINLQKFYGEDRVRIAIVAFGPGLKALLKADSPVADRVSSLIHYDVAFLACGNTLTAMHRDAADLIPGVTVVPAGVAEIVERSVQGWVYVHP